ncbi:hypothetical protein TNCV_2441791 [Trichonephila clavipes]|nr:hypothetical protein TNCV_2441791 [Trichonephila clavipes]
MKQSTETPPQYVILSDLKWSNHRDSKNGLVPPNFSPLKTKLENPVKKNIPATKISASSEEDKMKDSKTSPTIEKIQELISDLQNSLKSDSKNSPAPPNFSTLKQNYKIQSTTSLTKLSEMKNLPPV